jgi:two-component sensor histidine kinase
MQSNLSQFQKRQIELIVRVTPYAMAGHLLNTTILAVALAGSVPLAELIVWCLYSYSIAFFVLYRHLKNRGRSPRSFQRATQKAAIYAFFLALPWSSLAVLNLGALSEQQELILIAIEVGMAASGTILLSAMPAAAFVYMSVILLPSALKCVSFYGKGQLLLGALCLSFFGFLAALIVKTTRDIRERERAELALAERNAQLALAGETALVGSYAYDVGVDTMQVSEGYAAMHGLPEGTTETPRSQWLARVHPADVGWLEGGRSQVFRQRQVEYNVDYRIVLPGRGVRWIESRSFISYEGDGHPQRVVGVNIDITERKQAEDQRKQLNAELDHRVKNALATINAVVSHTSEEKNSVADFVAALEGRIQSMAAAHHLLSSRQWQGMSLTELVRRELAPYSTSNNTDISGPEVVLKPEAGQAIAMVLHELATNAAKYGSLSATGGHVSVTWSHRPDGHAQSWLCIQWEERGGPNVVPQVQSGYGTSVIRDLIPYELGGTVDLVHSPEGVCCKLEIPDHWFTDNSKPPSGHGRPQSASP